MLNYPFDKVEEGILYMGDESFYIFATPVITWHKDLQCVEDFIRGKWTAPDFKPGRYGWYPCSINRIFRNHGQINYRCPIKN